MHLSVAQSLMPGAALEPQAWSLKLGSWILETPHRLVGLSGLTTE